VKKVIALLLAVAVVALFGYAFNQMSAALVPWSLPLARSHPYLLAGAALGMALATFALVAVLYFLNLKRMNRLPLRPADPVR
jgi:lysylphosphatidylglycerol synthetase-like protein (DUF2156 family)